MSESTVGLVKRSEPPQAAAPPIPAAPPRPQTPELQTSQSAPVADARPRRNSDVKAKEQISTEELVAMLEKLNLTFDLFEIEADFSVDSEDNQIRIVVRNTRTNEVIRRIPAHEFKAHFVDFRNGVGLLIDSFL